jgi:diguanylate cyclase
MDFIKTIPLKYKIISIICFLLPFLFDRPDGSMEFIWLLYLIPPIIFANYGGLRGGTVVAVITSIIQLSCELKEYFTDRTDFRIANLEIVSGIFIVVCIIGFGIGGVVDRLKRKQLELEETLVQMEYLAHFDSLTGLPNRQLFVEKLKLAMSDAKQRNNMLAVLNIDIDRFKNINDTVGHSFGDHVVTEIAKRLKQCIRTEDTLSRQGGDEFAIILSDLAQTDTISCIAKKILDSIQKPIFMCGYDVTVTASIGISMFPNHGDTVIDLMKHVDQALYYAKEKGRNRFCFYTDNLDYGVLRKTVIERQLRKCLERNQLVLYFQPQYEILSGKIIGVEALTRWQDDVLGSVSPAEFIPVAEETGLIIPLGEWVLRSACQQVNKWHVQYSLPIKLSVNISCLQFEKSNFVNLVESVIEQTAIDPRQLELEITESIAMYDGTEIANKLQVLRDLGIRISIDDFGTGYSSLSYLKKFSIDTVKIDKSFVDNIANNSIDEELVAAIIALAHTMKFNVIAEGVETPEQLACLAALKCNEVQGYLFSEPLLAEECLWLISQSDQEIIC